ncbi:SDR family NAD(P)-dependent oxidoreductase [Paraburkholderia caballeronis]|uniref:SDR family NAD(P)-dependent oxidoreductase n=1 Tax=Paraburkholderia caballeronis TaxID=416943 RepID=UPI001066DA5E|nr:SDR family oxidoreductase [Paraburkholderia caballeronis]TDV11428.1 NAD(P)-dependent dehydrogenase (short-subunit alcohol dehydrogenase family) [Paraburkholderia caballeronis]TDV14618.1 NAD(P)-dependent dehydrogenase (short-subunit alcohol dehydrogenase family) [Paraburkholderia caballeronis]TDV23689.1 NAD(P)-dependent dehydrogenase (short-subunit alcohol dehydrogenase family) [Paraburkholderia caballeronis]
MTTENTHVSQAKIAIVTGASRGLGRNTALSLAATGVDVIVTWLADRAQADAVVEQIEALGRKAVALQLDAGNAASFGQFAADVQRALKDGWARDQFDFLVNNAGSYRTAPIGQITEADFDLLCNVHFKGVLFLTQALLPLLADGGRIVNVSSGLTRFAGFGSAAYASMKGAVEVLTRYMAKEFAPRGITVNTVAPGAIETDFGGGLVRDNRELNQTIAAATALGRVGLPDDIGPMIAALLSDANRWVTAQRIEASGGMFL